MFLTPENCNFNILSPLSSTVVTITTNAVFELARCELFLLFHDGLKQLKLKENYKSVDHQHKTNEAERSPCSVSCSISSIQLRGTAEQHHVHCGSICFTLICAACSVYTVLCKRLDATIIITLVLQKHNFMPVKRFYLWTLSLIQLKNWEQNMCFFRQAAIGDTTVVHPLT